MYDVETESLSEERCTPARGMGNGASLPPEAAVALCLPVDMLSPGDMPSRRPWSSGGGGGGGVCPGTVGGCGGGRLGLWRGLGVGRDLVSVPVSEGGEERAWEGTDPGDEAGI